MGNITICVYGNFTKKEVHVKVLHTHDLHEFAFQNILREAGYDAELYIITEEEIKKSQKMTEG